MPKRFSLAEASSLLPQLDRLLREAATAKSDYEEAERSIQATHERVMLAGGMVVDRVRALADRAGRERSAERLHSVIGEIQETGCLVKDLDQGLVDFPTLFRGVEVYLCWKLGESHIEFWHSVDDGFRGRKAIDQDFRDGHEGDRPH